MQLVELIAALLIGRRPWVPRHKRLRRMQATAGGVHRGGAGDSLPGAGHAGRLRGDLPELPPRMLRLLRPEGAAEPGQSRRLLRRPRDRAGDLVQLIRNFNGYAPEFREASNAIERGICPLAPPVDRPVSRAEPK